MRPNTSQSSSTPSPSASFAGFAQYGTHPPQSIPLPPKDFQPHQLQLLHSGQQQKKQQPPQIAQPPGPYSHSQPQPPPRQQQHEQSPRSAWNGQSQQPIGPLASHSTSGGSSSSSGGGGSGGGGGGSGGGGGGGGGVLPSNGNVNVAGNGFPETPALGGTPDMTLEDGSLAAHYAHHDNATAGTANDGDTDGGMDGFEATHAQGVDQGEATAHAAFNCSEDVLMGEADAPPNECELPMAPPSTLPGLGPPPPPPPTGLEPPDPPASISSLVPETGDDEFDDEPAAAFPPSPSAGELNHTALPDDGDFDDFLHDHIFHQKGIGDLFGASTLSSASTPVLLPQFAPPPSAPAPTAVAGDVSAPSHFLSSTAPTGSSHASQVPQSSNQLVPAAANYPPPALQIQPQPTSPGEQLIFMQQLVQHVHHMEQMVLQQIHQPAQPSQDLHVQLHLLQNITQEQKEHLQQLQNLPVLPTVVQQLTFELHQLQDLELLLLQHTELQAQGAPPPPTAPPAAVILGQPSANPHSLVSGNVGFEEFLRVWNAYPHVLRNRRRAGLRLRPSLSEVETLVRERPRNVYYDDLDGDGRDFQGVDWRRLGVTRTDARQQRLGMYKNYTNRPGTDMWQPCDLPLPRTDGFYRFRRMLIRQNIVLSHFQLRSVLACPSRSQAIYPGVTGVSGVHRLNLDTRSSDVVMDLSDMPTVQVTTLDAKLGMLVAGTFTGEYFLRPLDHGYGGGGGRRGRSRAGYVEGQITNVASGITNHLQIFLSRSLRPTVGFSSNDRSFRTMDLATEKFLSETVYPVPMNCSAVSPDGRLRVIVGDDHEALIVNAETGRREQVLRGHRDFGFACDWSEDGRLVATGFQDRTVKVWDSRCWCDSRGRGTPLATIRTEMASPRSLRFAPLGSGTPVLVAAEEADFVNVINARTLQSKQTFDVFGEIGGVAFTDEGRELNVLVCDRLRGGVLQLRQAGVGWDWAHALGGGGADDLGADDRWHNHSSTSAASRWNGPVEASNRRRAHVLDSIRPF